MLSLVLLVLAADPLRAGAAAIDITPTKFPVNMPGGFGLNLADKAHDPLHVRALVLGSGKTVIALVLVDSLGVNRETADEAKRIASRRVPILAENMLVSSTHTHSAPPANDRDGPEAAVTYRQVVINGIVEAIVKAHKAMRPAAVGHAAHALPDEVFNRRWLLKPGKMTPNPFGEMDQVKMNPPNSPDVLLRPAGPTDPDVTILSVEEAKTKKPLALYANYSLHYVGGTPRGQVSADYFGEFARLMPSRLRAGDGFVAMMTNGTSGDINNIPFGKVRPPREPFEQVRLVAARAADAAWHARQKIDAHAAEVPLAMIQKEVVLKTRRPTAKQVEWAKGVLALKDREDLAKLPPLATHYARRTLALAEGAEEVKVILQAARVGDLALCAIPFEVFAEIGLDLKKRSPFARTMVVGLANGYGGYLPTPGQHKLGGYETWLGTNRVQEDASEVMTKELLAMLERLKK
jgi:hypothetical protein